MAYDKAQSHLFVQRPPAGAPDRIAVPISSNYPEAVALVADRLVRISFGTVNSSPLSEARCSAPGQPAWVALNQQTRPELIANLAGARRLTSR